MLLLHTYLSRNSMRDATSEEGALVPNCYHLHVGKARSTRLYMHESS